MAWRGAAAGCLRANGCGDAARALVEIARARTFYTERGAEWDRGRSDTQESALPALAPIRDHALALVELLNGIAIRDASDAEKAALAALRESGINTGALAADVMRLHDAADRTYVVRGRPKRAARDKLLDQMCDIWTRHTGRQPAIGSGDASGSQGAFAQFVDAATAGLLHVGSGDAVRAATRRMSAGHK